MTECNIVLQLSVNDETLYFDTKFAVPPPVGSTVRVLPVSVNYVVRHLVTEVVGDPYTGQYKVLLENEGATLRSGEAAKFSRALQSYGWKKL